jgi:hypothetical protein
LVTVPGTLWPFDALTALYGIACNPKGARSGPAASSRGSGCSARQSWLPSGAVDTIKITHVVAAAVAG